RRQGLGWDPHRRGGRRDDRRRRLTSRPVRLEGDPRGPGRLSLSTCASGPELSGARFRVGAFSPALPCCSRRSADVECSTFAYLRRALIEAVDAPLTVLRGP